MLQAGLSDSALVNSGNAAILSHRGLNTTMNNEVRNEVYEAN